MAVYEPTPENFASIVVYEDNHLLVVRKPAGLLTQGDRSSRPNLLDLAKEYIRIRYDKPGAAWLGLVHRLDRQVAGVVVLARTSKAANRLSSQFRERRVEKVYWALVHGRPVPPEGRSVMHLVRQGNKTVPAPTDGPPGQPARLSYRTLDAGDDHSLLEIVLETGRKHQIRAQVSAWGHPIVGDRKYGSPVEPQADAIGLMARRLVFRHPTRNDRMTFEMDPPAHWPWTD